MKFTLYLALLAAGAAALCLARSNQEHWPVREQDTIQKTLTLSGAPMRLVADNVDGYVHVTGTSGSQVRVTAHRLIRAETGSDLQQAKDEVKLDITAKPGTVTVYYDAPWRCGGGTCDSERRRFYSVTYDIDIEVPRQARAVVSTVNRGDVKVDGVSGGFDVRNVNGSISMAQIGGSGDARTVNGSMTLRFANNPSAASSFKTVNGPLDIYFQPGLSADLLFKTLNGEIYSDFEVAPGPAPPGEIEHRDGKFIYHSRRSSAGRVGQGGPQLSFDALNGNIRLHREQ